MDKIYTRLKINETFSKNSSSDLHDLGGFINALRAERVTYQLTITKNGQKFNPVKGKFNKSGESTDYYIPVNAPDLVTASQGVRAFWEVFLDKHRIWFAYANQFFDHSIQNGSSPRSRNAGKVSWSIANIAMSQAHALLVKSDGTPNQVVVNISSCPHGEDGAIKVAEYIVEEIKKNVVSQYAKNMRYCNDLEGRLKEWQSLPLLQRALTPVPEPMFGTAIGIWTERVAQNRPWDHKPIIKKLFKTSAVKRVINPKTGTVGESQYHKYKTHDYFLDVWSNIHYGYVGMSSGYDESTLLDGAGLEQRGTNFLRGEVSVRTGNTGGQRDWDNIADRETISLGISLFRKYGTLANGLTAQVVLNSLERIKSLENSRLIHVCLDKNEPKFTPE